MKWLVVAHREVYDVPRMIVAEGDGVMYLFESPFDEVADDYVPYYDVYRLPHLRREELQGSWELLANRAVERTSSIALTALPFEVPR